METGYERPAVFEELFQYIQTYHPLMIEEYMDKPEELEEFINSRVQTHKNVYLSTLKSDKTCNDFQLARELAHEALYAGLHFSATSYLDTLYAGVFDQRDKTKEELVTAYKATKHIFDKYELNDDFEGTDKDVELEHELIDYIREHGI